MEGVKPKLPQAIELSRLNCAQDFQFHIWSIATTTFVSSLWITCKISPFHINVGLLSSILEWSKVGFKPPWAPLDNIQYTMAKRFAIDTQPVKGEFMGWLKFFPSFHMSFGGCLSSFSWCLSLLTQFGEKPNGFLVSQSFLLSFYTQSVLKWQINKKLVCILNLRQFAHLFNFDYYVW